MQALWSRGVQLAGMLTRKQQTLRFLLITFARAQRAHLQISENQRNSAMQWPFLVPVCSLTTHDWAKDSKKRQCKLVLDVVLCIDGFVIPCIVQVPVAFAVKCFPDSGVGLSAVYFLERSGTVSKPQSAK